MGLKDTHYWAGAGPRRCRRSGQQPGAGGSGRWSCFPSGPVAAEGTGRPEPGLGSRHPTRDRRQLPGRSLLRPPRAQPGADAAPPPSPCGSPRRPCGPSQPPAGRAGELGPPGALESSAVSARGEQSPPPARRRQPGPDCRAGRRGRPGLSARLGGPGARVAERAQPGPRAVRGSGARQFPQHD